MQLYRLRFERWRGGIGRRAGRFVPFSQDIEARSRKAAVKEAERLWANIRSDSVSTRFVELIEIVAWAPPSENAKECRWNDDRTTVHKTKSGNLNHV